MAHEGKHPYNAETTINYGTKDVSFNYTQDINRKNDWSAYADHVLFVIIGIVIGVYMTFFLIPFLLAAVMILVDTGVNIYFILIWTTITAFILMLACMETSRRAMGGISIILHENIPWLRKMYPKSNAISHILINKVKKIFKVNKIIDFSEIPDDDVYLRKSFMIIDNRLILKSNIVLCEYELECDCSKYITKVQTKCIEEKESKRKKPSVNNFMIVFEFSQRPKVGKVRIL